MTDVTEAPSAPSEQPTPPPQGASADAAGGQNPSEMPQTDSTTTNVVPDGSLAEPDMERPGAWRLLLVAAAIGGLWWWQGLALVIVILALVFMITMHEFGHYVTAKRGGMKVTQFFIGFGPRIWSIKRGETEYGVRAIPAGAFVKVPGMLRDEEVAVSDEPRSYREASFKNRVVMASAGSAMHFIMAFVLLVSYFAFFDQVNTDEWGVEEVVPGSAAEAAGVQPGDRVISVDGIQVEGYDEMSDEIRSRPGETVPVVVQRGDGELTLTASLGARGSIIGTVGEDLSLFFVEDGAILSSAGERVVEAGLTEDSVITAINDVAIASPDDLEAAAEASAGGVLELEFVEGGGSELQTASLDLGTAVAATDPEGMIGTTSGYGTESKSLVQAVPAAGGMFWDLSKGSITGLVDVMNPSNLANFFGRAATTGPGGSDMSEVPTPAGDALAASQTENETRPISMVGAASLATGMAEADWGNLIGLLALLNIFIGLFNLVPLLPFDGGHIAIAFYEKIRERAKGDGRRYFIDPAKMYPIAVVVVGVLGLLFLSTVYLDIVDPVRL